MFMAEKNRKGTVTHNTKIVNKDIGFVEALEI